MKAALVICILFLLFLLFQACTARRAPLSEDPAGVSANVRNGQQKYMQYCQKCHPSGESGLGPALSNNPAPGFVKRFQVRHGLGVMPSFKEEQLNKKDLKDILRYLRAKKHNPKLPV